MVKLMLILLVLFFPVLGHALTKAELQELNNIYLQKQAEREGHLNTNNLNGLLPKSEDQAKSEDHKPLNVEDPRPEKTEAPQADKKPETQKTETQKTSEADKYTAEKEKEMKRAQNKGNSQRKGPDREPSKTSGVSPRIFNQGEDGTYIAPPRIGGYDALVDAEPADKTRVFGIRIGTWIQGELRRPASSSEPGLIEIYTTETIRGDKKVLPSGTILFAQKTYNAGTKKQDFLVEKGITPQGKEFEIQGLVFDLNQTAGLDGKVSVDSEMIVERSTSKGVLAAGGAVAESLAQNSLVGIAGSAAAESLLEDSSGAVEKSKTLKQNIRTTPQKLLIRIEETF